MAAAEIMAAGVVLAGGRSTRMGRPKAALDWHGSTLLRHCVGVLRRAVDGPVLVVRAPGQPLPALPTEIEVIDDPVEGRGPLQGIAAGLAAVDGRAGRAFVCALDLPLLHPAFVARVLDAAEASVDVALARVDGIAQPLAAAYRCALAPLAAELIAAGERRAGALLQQCRVRYLTVEELLADGALAAADPALESLVNVNSPAQYETALARPLPEVIVWRGAAPTGTVRATTLAGAAASAGQTIAPDLPVSLNGVRIAADATLPLFTGDVVVFG